MTINDILKEKNMTKYGLSKKSGIAWSTLSDICSGKTSIAKCSVTTLKKISITLEMSIEDCMNLEAEQKNTDLDGKPSDRAYLELGLSSHLTKSINEYVEGQKYKVSYLDCLWGEVYGSINADLWSGVISEEQANYLRKKYL